MSTSLNVSLSDYYSGKGQSIGCGIEFNRIKQLKFDAELHLNRVNLPEGNFNTFTLSNRMVYAFSTAMYFKAYIQHNSDRLRYDGRVKWNANTLFRYIYKPGSNIYIVYNHEVLVGNNNDEITNRTLMAKVVYFWRK